MIEIILLLFIKGKKMIEKLKPEHKHILKLIKRDADKDGWLALSIISLLRLL